MRTRRNLDGFWSDVGTAIGNWGNSAQGGEDQAMYADPSATLANPGYATVAGAQNYGAAVVSILPNPARTLMMIAGAAIILFSLIDSD